MFLKFIRNKWIIKYYFLLPFMIITTLNCNTRKLTYTGPKVILKLDDLWYEDELVHEGWIAVMDFLNTQKVKGTIGLVGNSLEEGTENYYNWIKEREQEGHEIWNHGYCHCKPIVNGQECREFRGTEYAYQLDQLQKTQQLAKEKLGLNLVSFGAPYNATDSLTANALTKIPELKIWMYKIDKAPTDKQVLKRIKEVNIEYPVHIPNFQKFKAGYEQYKNEGLLVIQGHPRSWTKDKERMENFKKIVTFLKNKKVQFTTPMEYSNNYSRSIN